MAETLQIAEIAIELVRKDVKHVHLSVHPPAGRVSLVAPTATRVEVARAYAISKLAWIRNQRGKLQAQARETPRRFVERESHHVWGRRYLLTVVEADERPSVRLSHRKITLRVRPGSSSAKREEVMHEWHKALLHKFMPPLIAKWEAKLGVNVKGYYLQRMKTKWGGCNHRAGNIRLNTELVKKPKDLVEYVVVHEMLHLVEPTHSDRFTALLDTHYPTWREARAELNALPLGAEQWRAEGEVVAGTVDLVPSGHQVGTKSALSPYQVQVLERASVPCGLAELMVPSGRTDRTKFRDQVVAPLLDAGLLERTIPDKPRSSKQQYRTTEAGRAALRTARRP